MAEDRFANVFTAQVNMTAANTMTWIEMVFGITLRDRVAIVIDQIYWYLGAAAMAEMTTSADRISLGISISDQITNINDLNDRRLMVMRNLTRQDFGTAASGQFISMPLKDEYSPPLIVLPNRIFFGMDTVGLASAGASIMRMHYRTVNISQEQQLIEILEAFQFST